MQTFATLEHYIEVIAGKRDVITGASVASNWLGYDFKPIVSLARYDVAFLNNVTDHTLDGHAMTDRQAALAAKLVLKYSRQLHSLGINTEPVQTPCYRKPLRVLDRSKLLSLRQDQLCVQFPYDENLVEDMRKFCLVREGPAKFDKALKVWIIAATEFNTNYIHTWATKHGFEITQDVQDIMTEILQHESQPYEIQLRCDAQQVHIHNAPVSMLEYLHSCDIDLLVPHLLKLVDMSPVLGYSVHHHVMHAVSQLVGYDVVKFALGREHLLDGDASRIQSLVQYATLTNRLPVVVFDPSPNNSLSLYQRILGPEQVTELGNQALTSLEQVRTPVLFVHKAVNFAHLPLTVSHAGLIAGGEKSRMFQNSEKIVWFNSKLGYR